MVLPAEIVVRLAAAALLGSLVGIERQKREWAAGLRTHMLVCVGSALAMLVSAYGFNDVLGEKNVVLDPSRVAAQVISGIGFLGAGTILFLRQEVVKGLTTAAGLWTVAGIGLAVGGGLYVAACATTAIVLVILAVIKPLELKYFGKYKHRSICITGNFKETPLMKIEEVLSNKKIMYDKIIIEPKDDYKDTVTIILKTQEPGSQNLMALTDELKNIAGIATVELAVS